MHTERLGRMRDLLRRDAANPTGVKFDLGTWAEPAERQGHGHNFPLPEGVKSSDSHRYYTELEPIKVPVSCDTMACAFGLAAISGEFKDEGLSYSFCIGADKTNGTLLPAYQGEHGFEAAAALFRITTGDAQYFFDPDHYDTTPKEAEGELIVAQRIDDFINGLIDTDHHPDYRDSDED